jgi:peptidoglycan/LPS O-acetylase OafA/YrhL
MLQNYDNSCGNCNRLNKSLTSFRFFAFLAVFFFHQLVFPLGYLGVQAFFVLSGFLLTAILVEAKNHQTTQDFFISFYGRRALRIFPVYYAYLLIVSLALAYLYFPQLKSDIPVVNRFYQQILWALSYTYNFFHASDSFKHTYLLTHFWSLAVEEQFYLLWPIVIYFTPKEKLKQVLLMIIVMGPLVRWLTGELVMSGAISWLGDDVGLVVYVLPFSHFDAFAMGGFFALYGRACSGRSLLGLLFVIVLLGWIAGAQGYSNFMNQGYAYVWGYSLFSLFFAGCLVTLKECNPRKGWLVSPVLVYLGAISYGLYIFHNAFIWLADLYLPTSSVLIKIPLVFMLTLLVSAASYRWLEQPCLKLKDRYFPTSTHNPRL